MDAAESLLFALTYLGSAHFHVAVVAFVAWWVSPAAGRRLGWVLAASFASNAGIKEAVGHPRPLGATLVAIDGWPRLARRWGLFREPEAEDGAGSPGGGGEG